MRKSVPEGAHQPFRRLRAQYGSETAASGLRLRTTTRSRSGGMMWPIFRRIVAISLDGSIDSGLCMEARASRGRSATRGATTRTIASRDPTGRRSDRRSLPPGRGLKSNGRARSSRRSNPTVFWLPPPATGCILRMTPRKQLSPIKMLESPEEPVDPGAESADKRGDFFKLCNS